MGGRPGAAARATSVRRSLCIGLTAMLAAAAGTACGSILPPRNLKPPTVTVNGLSIDAVSLETVRFSVRLATHNPNTVHIPLSQVRFDLDVLGHGVARGAPTAERFTLAAGADSEIPVSFTVSTAEVRAALGKLLTGPVPETAWTLRGTAQWGHWPLPIPFEKSGGLDALRRLREVLRPR